MVQDGVQRRADAGQYAVLTDEIHEPHNGGTAGLLRGDGAGHDVGQQLSVLLRGPDIVLEVRIVEVPPPHVPHILARRVGRGGHTQRDQVRSALDFSKAQIALHGGQGIPQRLCQIVGAAAAQPVVMGQALGLPAQELVERAGVGADVIAGDDVSIQKPGQGVHQFQPHAVVAFGRDPDADPDVRPALCVGQYVPGGADVLAVLLRHGKLRHAAAARVVVVVQLGAVQQRQAHIKVCVDKVDDGGILAEACQPECCIRQWPNLP